MKKFLTFLMLLLAISSFGFAAKLPPADADASLTFTFTLDAADAAKNYAKFYDGYLTGANTVDKLKDLANKTSVTGPITYDVVNTGWAGKQEIYAAAGTNYTAAAVNVTLTLNPFTARGVLTQPGYNVNCNVVSKDGTTVITAPSDWTVGSDNVITVEDDTPYVITGTIKATEPVSGDNGILEFRFHSMKVTAANTLPDLKPTAGSESRTEYTASWVFHVSVN